MTEAELFDGVRQLAEVFGRNKWAPFAEKEPDRTAWFEAAARLVPPRG